MHKMSADTYQRMALRTESSREPLIAAYGLYNNRLLHAGMGLATEAGEFLDPLKKKLFYGKEVDLTNLKEEIGDLLWYIAIACDALDTTIEQEMYRNISKLAVRYPEKYADDAAINRDLDAERKILET